jgi:hypothetical protein
MAMPRRSGGVFPGQKHPLNPPARKPKQSDKNWGIRENGLLMGQTVPNMAYGDTKIAKKMFLM